MRRWFCWCRRMLGPGPGNNYLSLRLLSVPCQAQAERRHGGGGPTTHFRHTLDGQNMISKSTSRARESGTSFFVLKLRVPNPLRSFTPTSTISPGQWAAAPAALLNLRMASRRELSFPWFNHRYRRHLHLPWIALQAIRRDAFEHIPYIQRAVVRRGQIHSPVAEQQLRPSK
jgi:hypothetical protein